MTIYRYTGNVDYIISVPAGVPAPTLVSYFFLPAHPLLQLPTMVAAKLTAAQWVQRVP